MHTDKIKEAYDTNNQRNNDRPRFKTSPSANDFSLSHFKKLDQTIITFSADAYSFLNSSISFVTLLKTVINSSVSTNGLQKLVQISHPNIISIKKILKSHSKDTEVSKKTCPTYSIFYQPVHFSIRYLMQHPSQNQRLFNLLLSTDLKSVLYSISDYLKNFDVFYPVRPDDIGITFEGNLKVFIPALAVFQSRKSSIVTTAIQNVLEWWEEWKECFNINVFKKDKKAMQLQPPKLDNIDLSLEEGSQRSSNLERELDELLGEDEVRVSRPDSKPELKGSTASLSRVGSAQFQKLKKIDEQVKNIKEKVNKNKKNTQQKAGLVKKEEILSGNSSLPSYYREAIQQNINCINIYNHNNHLPPPRFATLPAYQQPYYYGPEQEEESQHDDEDDYSQDTYDIQFQNQFQPTANTANRASSSFRPQGFAPSERDLSQYPKKKNKKRLKEFRSKQVNNPVCNKNYTESAGPLQFKNFVKKYTKQQVQDTQHRPSQIAHSKEDPVFTRCASSDPRLKNFTFSQKDTNNIQAFKRINSENMIVTMHSLNAKDSDISMKVKQALQKTKNAIDLLNRVKKNRVVSKNVSMK